MFTKNPSDRIVFGSGSSTAFTEKMRIDGNGYVGIGVTTPNARLSISVNGTELAGTASGNTLRTNAGTLGTTTDSEISLANIGFLSASNSSLGIRAYRTSAGTDWTSTALLLGYDVDNTVRAGGGFLALNANGGIGIGTTTPQAKLDVNGNTRTSSLTISTGGDPSDFLIKNDVAGQVSFRKGYAGLGLNYIIRTQGAFPTQGSGANDIAFIGEIKLFAGNFAPNNWAFCNGQILSVNAPYADLFALIGTTYGGDGVNNFRLPDLRDAVPVGVGTNWQLGERSN
jgi:microcystin-dependent protein